MGETDVWEAGTDNGKTTATLGTNRKVTARKFCPQFFCILVIKQLHDVLQKLLGIQILVEWKQNFRHWIFLLALLPNSMFGTSNKIDILVLELVCKTEVKFCL